MEGDAAPGTYYFALTAFDRDGSESDYSNEVIRPFLEDLRTITQYPRFGRYPEAVDWRADVPARQGSA